MIKAILLTGLLAGTLDGLAAIINYLIGGGKYPGKIFQFISSGVFGKDAFSGDYTMILMGIFFHFIIAFVFTIVYFLFYHKIKAVLKNNVVAGLVYGVLVWIIMNLLILPASNVPAIPFKLINTIIGAVILMLCVGLPISVMADRYHRLNKLAA